MKWEEYAENYRRIAKLQEKSDEYCIYQLEYAHQLFIKNLPIIYSPEHFFLLVGYMKEYVMAAANGSEFFYRTFYIDKKNGKKRRIDEPLPSLKEIQHWILHEILDYVPVSSYAKAFVKGSSVRDNARFHRRQKKVLTMDIENFFPSIEIGRVLHLFRKLGYRESVAVLLTNLCCFKGYLPQGAPTSPTLANLIAGKLDEQIINYIAMGKSKIRYTRYADDLTFSGDFNEGDLIKNVQRIANRQGFRIKEEKTRVRRRNQRQEVTGIVVNEKMQVSRELRRQIRSDLYYIQKYGLDSHIEYKKVEKEKYLQHLQGLIAYSIFINPKDEKMKEYMIIIKNIKKY
ncbi:retron St85 family RNA-directed DNA polymerase [Blautia obeum]|uniref:retron St85 family RNA-directed DNA polymerase n=1 Tax=Blautia obeum TaxID=40520 RepID=UPI00356695A6